MRKIFLLKRIWFVGFVFVFILLTTIKFNFFSWNSYYFYSDLSTINGINTIRGYMNSFGFNDILIKILFNKLLFLPLYFFKVLTFLFVSVFGLFF